MRPARSDRPLSQRYSAPDALPTDHLAYSGTGTVQAEHVDAARDFAIDLAFWGRQVFLALGGDDAPLQGKCCWMDDPSRLSWPATMSAGTATWSCANIGSTGSSTWAAPGPVA